MKPIIAAFKKFRMMFSFEGEREGRTDCPIIAETCAGS
jgi:hypothetical protein